jgi:hypothetical protein
MASGSGVQYIPTGGPGPVTTWQGIYYGYIAVNVDPLDQGRVKVRVPQVFGNVTSGWASPMVPVTYIPKVGTAVTVMFVGGDPARPVWSGNFAVAGTPPVVIGSGTPTAAGTQVGEIYYDSANGMKTWEWNGTEWIEYQIGTGGIVSGVGLTEPAITGGTITGSQFIATGTSGEILAYTGDPALGNLLTSVSGANGTDPKGNPYLDGVTVYSGKAHLQASVNAADAAPAIGLVTGAGSEYGTAALYTWPPNEGAADESIITWLQGPSSTVDHASAAVVLQSTAKDSSSAAYGGLLFNGGTVATWDTAGFHVSGTLHGNSGTLTVADVIQVDSDVHISGTLYGVGGVITVGDRLSAGTWQNMTLANGWTLSGTGFAQFKLMPDHTVMVRAAGLLPGITGDGTYVWEAPTTTYYSTFTETMSFPIVVGYSTAPSAPTATPQVAFHSDYYLAFYGLVGTTGTPGTVAGVSFTFSYPLD